MTEKSKTVEEEKQEIFEDLKNKINKIIKNLDNAIKLLSESDKAEDYAQLNKREEENGNAESG